MAKALRDGELDAALLLTEGAVAAIADGAAFKIVSLYTDSPLVWGIHVPATSRFRSEADLRGARYAISRLGSGSHLMAFVHARAKGWPVEQLAFVPVGNLGGAVDAFAGGTADVFFWEKFMTKPLVDAARFRRVAEFTAPWPAFVVCVADAVAGEVRAAIMTAVALVLARSASVAHRPRGTGRDRAAVRAGRRRRGGVAHRDALELGCRRRDRRPRTGMRGARLPRCVAARPHSRRLHCARAAGARRRLVALARARARAAGACSRPSAMLPLFGPAGLRWAVSLGGTCR